MGILLVFLYPHMRGVMRGRGLCMTVLLASAPHLHCQFTDSVEDASVTELAYEGVQIPPLHKVNTSGLTPPLPPGAVPNSCPSTCLVHGLCRQHVRSGNSNRQGTSGKDGDSEGTSAAGI